MSELDFVECMSSLSIFSWPSRVGCLPYSHHGRATVTVDESGMVKYADWWGYEITMVELLAEKYGFR